MRIAFSTTLLVCLAVFYPVLAQDESPVETPAEKKFPRVDATDKKALGEHLGKKVTVFGLIKSTKDWDGGANFLNFDSREFMLVCFESEYANFPDGKPAKLYKGKHVEVTGYINEYKKKLQIKLTHPGQIKIVDPKKEAKEKAEADAKAKKEKADSKAKGDTQKEKPKPKKVDPKKYFCD
jgi:DNA/RNA endonuclease YhcR with UshA esterase domain